MDYGNDPRESVRKAIMYAQKAISISNNDFDVNMCIAYSYSAQAHYELQQGINPLDSIKRGEQAIQEAIKLNPRSSFCEYDPLSAVEARWLMKQHRDPAAAFDRAVKQMESSIAYDPLILLFAISTQQMYTVGRQNGKYQKANQRAGKLTRVLQ